MNPGDAADDPALVERFRSGDPRAFDEIVGRHRMAVYRMARRLLGTHEDADEAAQQTLVRAWRAREQFRGDAALKTWLLRITINVARSMRAGGRRMESLDDLLEPVADAPGAEQVIGLEQARRKVREAVLRLPPRQREVVQLKVLSERTHREVAEIMELSEGAVKAHLHQAVSNLRKLMSEMAEVTR